MMFHKFIHPRNCRFFGLKPVDSQSATSSRFKGEFGDQYNDQDFDLRLDAKAYEGNILHLEWVSTRWGKKPFDIPALEFPEKKIELSQSPFSLSYEKGLNLYDDKGQVILQSSPEAFGVCGKAFLYQFKLNSSMKFFGMGEKLFDVERSRKRTKFWNTDVFADFHWTHHEKGEPDPMYISIPYLIVRNGNHYMGLLIDNPACSFMDTGSSTSIEGFQDAENSSDVSFQLGTESLPPSLVIIDGPDLPSLTRKLQSLVGKVPLPPAWSLGYHQCRWGYESDSDLEYLDNKFTKYQIPCDGLWIDIDYMEGYRVFTISQQMFSDPKTTTQSLAKNGRHVVPIIDPGVKYDVGYSIFDEGFEKEAFCINREGLPYVGLVWPGETVFPDFSQEHVRKWWADHVAEFTTGNGFSAYWIDMNDPSTGPVENDSMLFQSGTEPHETFHNIYANGMAKATRDGLLKAKPNQRPFVLSRSGFTGINKYSAVWTGDNHSNEHYLRKTMACSLNLALSGVPFNAPDMGGFGHNCTGEMLCKWMKLGFLFPFCRNHSAKGTRNQEPWEFDDATLDIVRHYIRMRYRLRPYLYQLFCEQEETGEAIIRPLFYDFEDNDQLKLHEINDQMMVGPNIMQAPILSLVTHTREVYFPDCEWYSFPERKFVQGNEKRIIRLGEYQTPIFARAGSIIPISSHSGHASSVWNPKEVELHVLVSEDTSKACGVLTADDGLSFDYRDGNRTRVEVVAENSNGTMKVDIRHSQDGFGSIKPVIISYKPLQSCILTIDGKNECELEIEKEKRLLFGTDTDVYRCTLNN